MGDNEITKDFRVEKPSVPGRTYGRDFTLAELEDVLWQFRAAGADDATQVSLSYDSLTARQVPAFMVEIPPAARRPATRQEPLIIAEPKSPWLPYIRAGIALAALFVVPGLIWALVMVWRLTIGAVL